MKQLTDNFVYCANRANDLFLSFKVELPVCRDFIGLPMLEYKTGRVFSLSAYSARSALEVVTSKLYSLSLSISDAVFHCAKRVLRRAVAGVRHFVCSNQREVRRVAPMVPMALRL